MASLSQDLRFAVRLLAKDRGFTLLAVVALALGIGANNTIFTFVNAVLVRGLPFHDPDAIMYVGGRQTARGEDTGVSWRDLEDFRTTAKTFQALAAFRSFTMNVSDEGHLPERMSGVLVTANTFGLIGQQPLLGRDFAPGEDAPGAESVVILGYAMWQSRYGGDPDVLGRVIKVNELPSTIVGVMPPGMQFPTNAEMWQPFPSSGDRERRDRRNTSAFGRLAHGATRRDAQAELSAIAGRLAREYPQTNQDLDAVVMTFNERYNGGAIRLVFLALMGAVGFVLLIACANVANLLLARSAHRAREIAVRVAMGASRGRVVRQLLIESVVLGLAAGTVGLLLSYAGVQAFSAAVEDVGKPYWIRFTMDATVFAFLAAVCLLTSVLFGLAPALQVSRTNVNDVLKEGGRSGSAGARARRFSATMVVAQITLTIVLLAGAGLMIRSFFKMYGADLGLDTSRLLVMRLGLVERKYPEPSDLASFHERLEERLNALAGVEAAAAATALPLGGGERSTLELEARPVPAGEPAPTVSLVRVGPRYFDALGLAARRGRTFTAADGTPGAEVAVVNERFAARFFPGEDPLGWRLRFGDGPDRPWMVVVGVTPTVRQRGLQELEADAVAYVPLRQDPPRFVSLILRGAGEPGELTTIVREEVRALDPDLPVYDARTMDEFLARQRWPFRVFGSLFTIFALIALVLSAVGIYAVMAYSVTQRRQEIGVRMALGAQGHQVSWLVLRQGLLQLAIGLVLGLAGAFGVGRVLESLLVQIPPSDPVTFAGVAATIALVTIAACLLPARRAMELDPVTALRTE